jgi:hypothetical protein
VTTWTVARSISRPVRERLRQGRSVARVLAVFERACDLITPGGDVIALVTPQIGDGPLNVVVDGGAGLFDRVHSAAPVTLGEERLQVDGLRVDLGQATAWEPRPAWEALRARRATIVSRLPPLRDLCLCHSPAGTLAQLPGTMVPLDAFTRAVCSTAQNAAQALREGWRGAPARLGEGAAGLAGLGGGLTPSGDDFLVGVMLWAWLAHPTPDTLCCTLVKAAVPRTTTLSGAFLRAAARGECHVSWHRLLEALCDGGEAQIAAAVPGVLAHGATSGADGLAGFLYLSSP